jgi:hypothetical protein
LPDRSKRKKTFKTERDARQFEAKLVTDSAAGVRVDPRGGKIALRDVYQSWLASRPDLSAKVRCGYEDTWRLRIEPQFGSWPIGKIDHQSIQQWVNAMSASGLGPRTVRWTHSVLKMTLDRAIEEDQLLGKNPAARTAWSCRIPATGRDGTTAVFRFQLTACRWCCAGAPYGAPAEFRSPYPRIKSPLLFRVSYGGAVTL